MTVSRLTLCMVLFSAIVTTSIFSSSAWAQEWIYTTVAGDNLWNLSEQHLDSVSRFKQLQQLNNIKNPRQMQPGTRLRVPLKWIRSNPVAAKIIQVQGQAELLRAADNSIHSVAEGHLIQLGDRIRSGADTTLAIRFADNTILTLYSNSLIRFDHLSAHGTTGMVDSRLHLLKGRLDTRVTPASGPGSRFEIETPSAISAVRGTEYRASTLETGQQSTIEVLHGKVLVSGAKQKRQIKAGYGTQVEAGKAPIAPQKLLPPPRVETPTEPIRDINGTIHWHREPLASHYRIELSDNAYFNTLLWQQLTRYTRAPLPDLPDGEYFVRVRAIDQLGIEGQNRVFALTLDAKPQPPMQLSPAHQQVVRGPSAELQWTTSEAAVRYRLEIATDSNFSQLIVDDDSLQSNRYDASALPVPGHYFWRLTSITADHEYGPPSIIREWESKPVPAKIDAQMEASEGMLVASWPSGELGATFQIQLAYDQAFTDLQTDLILSEPQFAFEAVKNQVRYLRVRSLTADGYTGPWGTPQKVIPITDYTPLTIWGAIVMLLLL
ncbi:FecR domain-containing protein [Amphritea sp. 1_MG-2023]|uniref:FecR domain-containing protein n=1 Tax=Amphritea sp. 1_MG-2023 TaxID=3062670 RepID=UPI0026E1BCFC|nr:FecR domain-containing protein [Amphritea sp. 1_MG-2023]MDO6564265.1 FecR domain-containing protein [Amphritea sp. 1_MG-2023]